jgi:hypothetical protein
MSKEREIIRKFEKMLKIDTNSEVRPDSVGALGNEVRESERLNSRKRYVEDDSEENIKLGHFVYDFKSKEETFIPYKKRD